MVASSAVESSVGSPASRALALVLRQLRDEAGLSQVELAERLAIPQQLVSSFELAGRRLDVIQAREYALALGVTLPDLVQRLEGVIAKGAPTVEDLRSRSRRRDAQRS